MAKFINQVALVENENCQSQLEFDTNVLSAAVVYMAEYYKDIFDGLGAVLKAARCLPNTGLHPTASHGLCSHGKSEPCEICMNVE